MLERSKKFRLFSKLVGENMISHRVEKTDNFFLLLEFGQFKTLRRYSLRIRFDILNLNPPLIPMKSYSYAPGYSIFYQLIGR